jgi:CoA:oxalate CoA-transferase
VPSIFEGIKILDFTKAFSGPFATRNFADYGATVIKIENTKSFDSTRNFPPLRNNWSGYFEILNRNKKSISLDLKTESDLEAFYEIIKHIDVFVENASPVTKYRLKIDYPTLRKLNKKLIYASLSGIGQHSNRKYYDVIAQAESGLMSLTGYPKEPLKIGPSIVDAFSGMTFAFAISSALFYREKTGKGQFVETSMLAASMNLLESNLIDYSINKKNPPRVGNSDTAIAPFGVYKAKNGYVAIAAGSEDLWNKLVDFLQRHTAIKQARFASNQLRLNHTKELTQLIEKVFARFSPLEIQRVMDELGIPCGQVYTMKEVSKNKDLFKHNALIKITHPKLGTCIVPGFATNFSEMQSLKIKFSPQLGENSNEY